MNLWMESYYSEQEDEAPSVDTPMVTDLEQFQVAQEQELKLLTLAPTKGLHQQKEYSEGVFSNSPRNTGKGV